LQALFAEAEILAGGSGSGTPKMVELIDTIMSIPSCLQDQQSKIQVVNKWIKEHKNYETNESTEEEDKEKTELEEGSDKTTPETKNADVSENKQAPISAEGTKENIEEEIDSIPDAPNSTKRRKNSRTLIKSSKSRIKKLKEVDNNIKAIIVYQNLEKEECQRPKLLYKHSKQLLRKISTKRKPKQKENQPSAGKRKSSKKKPFRSELQQAEDSYSAS